MNVHVLIADDEFPARNELRFILADLWPEAHFHEAVDGEEALQLVAHRPIQVVFLDINMPELTGLQVAAALLDMPDPPLIVFATAYDEHALTAFDLAAVDYVVKPFDERRLAKTKARLVLLLDQPVAKAEQQATVQTYVSQTIANPLTKLWGEQENESRILVDYEQIAWAEARKKHVYITVAEARFLVRHTLKELEILLQPYNFVRVQRSYLVNIEFVAKVEPWFSGGYLLHMKDAAQSKIPMSRRYVKNLKTLIDW